MIHDTNPNSSHPSLLKQILPTPPYAKNCRNNAKPPYLLGSQITFVSDQKLVHILSGVFVDLIQPLLDVVEALFISAVVNNNNAVSAPVIRRRDRPKPLLTRGVPDLKLNRSGES